VPSELVTPGQLVHAYWGHYERGKAIDGAREPRPYDPAAGDTVLVEGDGWRVIQHKRSDDEPDEPETGLEWGYDMVDCIAASRVWDDEYEAREEGREQRVPPMIERLELLELLAERAPDEKALGYLGAGALEDYLGVSPDVDRVEQAALRNERFRVALTGAWFDRKLSPDDAKRLRRFGEPG
jgi:hypothetical protein